MVLPVFCKCKLYRNISSLVLLSGPVSLLPFPCCCLMFFKDLVSGIISGKVTSIQSSLIHLQLFSTPGTDCSFFFFFPLLNASKKDTEKKINICKLETPVDTLLNQRINRTPFHPLCPINYLGARNTPHMLEHHTKWLRSPLHAEMFTQKTYYHTQRQYFFVDMSKIVRFFQCPSAKLFIHVWNNIFSSFGLGCLVWFGFFPPN